ncbi:unnamed protein product [Orchesella dallaii]|uniref:Uncharacterized protein n=1 Tax=Orchesella dallaii TaxID=48710 RepID=A0ABP1RE12_9HEXA
MFKMNSNGSGRQFRSNVNAFTRPRVPAATDIVLDSNSFIKKREDFTTPEGEKIADLEEQLADFKVQLTRVYEEKCEAEKRVKIHQQQLKRAQEELVYLRERLDSTQVDASNNGQLAVERVPRRVAGDLHRSARGENMEMEGRFEELTNKCKELERKLKKSDENKVSLTSMLRNSNADLILERTVAVKLRDELEKARNSIENVLADINVMRMSHQVNPVSPCPSSASAMNVTVGMTPPSQEIGGLNLPHSDIEELEEEEDEFACDLDFMQSMVNGIPQDKLAALGIFDDDDEDEGQIM